MKGVFWYVQQVLVSSQPTRGGVVVFLTIFAILFLPINTTAFAKLDNGAYLVAAANNSSNKTNNTTNKPTTPKSKYEQQIENYTNKIDKGDRNYKNYIARGEAYYNLAREKGKGYEAIYDKSEADFTAVINSPDVNDKARAEAYEWRAEVYLAQRYKAGMSEKAKNDFLQAGRIYTNDQKYTEATTAVEKALAIDRNSGEAWNLMGNIESARRHYDTAISQYTTAIGCQNYNLYIIYARRGWAKYNRSKQVDDDLKRQDLLNSALEDFNESFNKQSSYEFALEGLFVTHFALKNYDDARNDFKRLSAKTQEKHQAEERILYPDIDPDPIIPILPIFDNLDGLFKVFLIAISINFLLALAYKFKTHTLTIISAIQELLLIVIFLVIVMSLDAIDDKQLVPMSSLQDTILILFLAYTLLSILENAGHLGVPIPDWLTNLLQNIIDAIRRFFRI